MYQSSLNRMPAAAKVRRGFVKTAKTLGLIAAATMVLSACGTTFRSDVATFHTMAQPKGESIALTTLSAEKAESLEYAQYAGIIGNELQRLGFTLADEGASDLTVSFDLAISDGRERLRNRPGTNMYGPWGFGCLICRQGFINGGWWGPGFGNMQNEIVAETVYHTELVVAITDADGERVFDGRAESDVRGNKLAETVPLLARSLFRDFPGESGVTRRIILPAEEVETLKPAD